MMKTNYFKNFLFLPFLLVMLLASCQDEVIEVTNPDNEETIAANSTLANLMRNTARNDGSVDNIIDFANCLEIQLPVMVIVDDITITIDSETDFDDIEDIFDEFDDDEDTIEIVFPITVISSDYTEIVIENQEALDELIRECNGEDEEDEDIECIDFQYPITISVYNTDFEVIETATINDDEALYDFIEGLEGGVLASLNFPVTMVLSDGSTVVVENNAELEAAISEAEDTCDEDDDYDWDDDDDEECTEDYVASMLTECNWYYATSLYTTFVGEYFNFSSDGTALIYNAETGLLSNTGTWTLSSETDDLYLDLEFDSDPYSLLTLSWELVECGEDRFEFVNGDNNLVFEQDCEEDPIEDCEINIAELHDWLIDCDLEAYTYDAAGNAIDINYLNFNAGGEVIVNGIPAVTEVGTWELSESGSGYVLTINGLGVFDLMSGEWLLLGCEEDNPIFQQGVGSEAITMELEQDCSSSSGSGSVEDLEQIVVEGEWIVANYNDSGVDETDNYDNFVLSFNADGSVVATNGTDTLSGTWSGVIDSGQLKFVLDFGAVVPFDEFNDDWDVLSLADTRIELRDVSGGSGEVDTLTLERL